jgi:peptide/nickel transport system substrate-binding protein
VVRFSVGRRTWLAAVAASVLLVPAGALPGTTGAASHTQSASRPVAGSAGTLVIPQEVEPDSLDNAHTINGPSFYVFQLIYDTLVVQDSPTKFTGEIASSWNVSANGLIYTFQIRPGLKFSNGDPLTAKDVAFTFNRILSPATKSPDTGLIGPIKTVTAPSPSRVVFTLSKPFPYELNDLAVAYAGIEDGAVVTREGASYGRKPVGSGPFMLKSWVSGEYITLVPNPYYHSYAPSDTNKGEAYLREIKFLFIPNQESEVAAMQSGEANLMEQFPLTNYEQFKANPSYDVKVIPGVGTIIYLEFKTEPGPHHTTVIVPPFNDLMVRQAAGYALNSAGIVQAANYGLGLVEYGIINQGTDAYDPDLKSVGFHYDPAKAKALLTQAGWKPGAGGIRYKDGKPLAISLWTFTDGQLPEDEEIVASELEAVGFSVKEQSLELSSFEAEYPKGNFQADIPWIGWPNSTVLNVIESLPFGSAGIPDPRLVKLETEAETTLNLATRRKLYDEAQTYILREAYAIPIYSPETVGVWSKAVHGVLVNTYSTSFDFTDTSISG